MKYRKIKSETKEEIVKYMRSKVKRMIMDVTNGAKNFGEVGEKWSPWKCKKNELFELESNTIEQQINSCIQSGSPLVVVSLAGYGGVGAYREQFILTDYGDIRTNLELEKCDNLDLRNEKISKIKMLMEMELDAEERWDRILKVVKEFEGVSIPMKVLYDYNMNTRTFLKTSAALIGSPLLISSTPKPVDKYDDPNYGNTWKTVDSIFTVREIEMFCREWGWIHVEHFKKKYDDMGAQNWLCQAGMGYFDGIDGNEYSMWNTLRGMYDRVNPYSYKQKDEFKKFLKLGAGDYYWKGKREHYYFYDVLMPPGDYVHDAYHDWDGKEILTPTKESLEGHGKKYGKMILYHMGVSHGKMWGYINE